MNRIIVNAGGTYGFMAEGSTLRKITLGTGAHTTLDTKRTYTTLCYGGNSVLYGASNDEIGIINQSTGAFTVLVNNLSKVSGIMYKDTDEIWIMTGDALKLINTDPTTATGTAVITTETIASITIVEGGVYPSTVTPGVIITSDTGTGATGTAVMTAGVVTSVTIDEDGSGYEDATVVFDTAFSETTYVKQGF